jgi:hypothetical protein
MANKPDVWQGVTVSISKEQNQRIDAICRRTGVSKKRVVRTLLEFALPTYEQTGKTSIGGGRAPADQSNSCSTMTPAASPDSGHTNYEREGGK